MELKKFIIIFFIQFSSQTLFENKNLEIQDQFETWFMKHRRVYQTKNEYEFRFATYMKNHNDSYQLELNQFADLTDEEFRRFYSNPQVKDNQQNLLSVEQIYNLDLQDIKQEINWSEELDQGPAKDQKQCGSCYIFTAVGLAELEYAISNNTLVKSFSEQQLLDCGYQVGMNDCGGGSPTFAAQYLHQYGAIQEKDNPYQARKTVCQQHEPFYLSKKPKQANGNIKALIQLLNKGAVGVSMEISNTIKFYKSGVYDSKAPCGFFDNHGMVAVGYNLKERYIILRNSWGQSWGNNGYMKWYFGDDLNDVGPCGIADYMVFLN